jgi:hypothetical protein
MAMPCPPLRFGPSGDASLPIAALGPSQDRGSNEDGVTTMKEWLSITEYDRNGHPIRAITGHVYLETARIVAYDILKREEAVQYVEIERLEGPGMVIGQLVEVVQPELPW